MLFFSSNDLTRIFLFFDSTKIESDLQCLKLEFWNFIFPGYFQISLILQVFQAFE